MHALAPPLSGLLEARAYAHPVSAITLVQTHISWVLLTGEWAYKIKRPVHYPFVDLRDGARRHALCEEELRLNRRFAPSLYAEVVPIVRRAGQVWMGGEGEVIEYAVRMRQFSRNEELRQLVAAGDVTPEALQAFGERLADIHASLPVAQADDAWATAEAVDAAVCANLSQTLRAAQAAHGTAWADALHAPLQQRLAQLAPWMRQRHHDGRVRECHGDLHCGNVVRWQGALSAFDCLEFEPAFRWIDVAHEVAFLVADLRARGAGAHAHAFLAGYLARSGDYAACPGLPLYAAHCALVRAKVAALAAADADPLDPDFNAYVRTAAAALAPAQPPLVVMTGLSGSGKSWLAAQLAPRLQAISLRSDVERRRRAGVPLTGASGSSLDAGLYTAQTTAALYEALAHGAGQILAGGLAVILDATFDTRAKRDTLRALAHRTCRRPLWIHCHAPVAVLQQRVRARAARGADPSEADEAVLQRQLQHAEGIAADEGWEVLEVDTATPLDAAALDEIVRRCRVAAR